ncbi:MAG: serine/threonine protein kinase [Myxococcales bacterium]|nr:serine/threonine protein kinase [Myxococcales bacterium]
MREPTPNLAETVPSLPEDPALIETRASVPPPPAVKRPEAPARIGRFVVLRHLGAGGMGQVFLAYDEALDRKVALKLLRAADWDEGRARLRREAQAMARVAHPNVVPIFEVGEHAGQVFLAMEYVVGVTLKEWAEAAPRGWREIVGVYLQAARGLQAAHAVDVVHRDFKPENALVSSDVDGVRVRVLDFGLAALPAPSDMNTESDAEGSLDAPAAFATVAGTVMGTPAYMAPEQHRGRPADARADVFALAVTLFAALWGERPFAGATRRELLAAIEAGEIRPPAPGSDAPPELHAILRRGLAADPDARWPTMEALADALAGLVALDHDDASDRRRGQRLRAFAALGAVVLASLVLLAELRLPRELRSSVAGQTAVDILVVSLIAVTALVGRRHLVESRFNRRLFAFFAAFALGILGNSLVLGRFGADPAALVAVDFVTLGVAFTLASALLDRVLGWTLVPAAIGLGVALLAPDLAFLAFDLTMLATTGILLRLWWSRSRSPTDTPSPLFATSARRSRGGDDPR